MDELMGTIKLFAGNFAPVGYALCNGQLLPINQYQALFSIIGTTYGGDGRNNFALPDLRSRVPVGAGQGAGLTNYVLGTKNGVESNVLNQKNIPTLNGAADVSTLKGSASGEVSTTVNASIPVPCSTSGAEIDPVGKVFGSDTVNSFGNYSASPEPGKFMQPLTANLPIKFSANLPVTIMGGSIGILVNKDFGLNPLPVNNIQPSLGLHYIICTEGIYPQRP